MPDILGRMWFQRRNEFHYDHIYLCLCVHRCVHRCVHIYLHLSVQIYLHRCVHIHLHLSVHLSLFDSAVLTAEDASNTNDWIQSRHLCHGCCARPRHHRSACVLPPSPTSEEYPPWPAQPHYWSWGGDAIRTRCRETTRRARLRQRGRCQILHAAVRAPYSKHSTGVVGG